MLPYHEKNSCVNARAQILSFFRSAFFLSRLLFREATQRSDPPSILHDPLQNHLYCFSNHDSFPTDKGYDGVGSRLHLLDQFGIKIKGRTIYSRQSDHWLVNSRFFRLSAFQVHDFLENFIGSGNYPGVRLEGALSDDHIGEFFRDINVAHFKRCWNQSAGIC